MPERILHIDCSFGAAGDMLSAALLDLAVPEEAEALLAELNSIGVPGVEYELSHVCKCGISGAYLSVRVHGEEEDDHNDEHLSCDYKTGHEHSHSHSHVHRGLADIEAIFVGLSLSDEARAHALAIYKLIAEAESQAHGVDVAEVHFHEVGAMDAIADVAAFCVLFEKLGVDRITATDVGVGSGQIRCAHGILPVPAPATAYILKGVPMCNTNLKGELCTPTGAAILKHFASEFGVMPVMSCEETGYGMGKKDFDWPNCVRAMLGTAEDRICELECNLDDMTAEAIAYAMERLYEAGAVEVFTTSVGMKKSRPGTLLTALCHENVRDAVVEAFFKHTTTIGLRETLKRRYILGRESELISTPYGDVRCKKSSGYGVEKYKYEYDDISDIAHRMGMSLSEVVELIERNR